MSGDRPPAPRGARHALLDPLRRLLGVRWLADEIGALRGDVRRVENALAPIVPFVPLARQVAELRAILDRVELYQPVFRLSHLPPFAGLGAPKRACEDRLHAIRPSWGGSLENVRILDVGSSLGYVSLSLAAHGARVVGLESSPQNCDASRLIAAITGVPAEFRCGELDETFVDALPERTFDAALLLSVFHHVIHATGLERARETARVLLEKIPVGYFELALREEAGDYAWKASLPEDPLALFDGIEVDVNLLGFFPTHLSDTKRPLYRVASRSPVTVNGKAYPSRRTSSKAYAESPVVTNRRYHFSEGHVIKEIFAASVDDFDGILQALNEIAILRVLQRTRTLLPPDVGVELAALVDFEIAPQRACLVFERAPGELLSDVARALDEPRKAAILSRLQRATAHLEREFGLHHNDLRLWNLLYDAKSERLTMIDFGLAGHARAEDPRIAMAWLAAELDQGRILTFEPRRTLEELERVPWRSPALRAAFEECRHPARV